MPSGSRRRRANGDEYIFVDGRAVRADEAVCIDVSSVAVPGQEEAGEVPGSSERPARERRASKAKQAVRAMDSEDALDMRDDALEAARTLAQSDRLFAQEKRKARRKHLAFGGVLLVLVLFSLCVSDGYFGRIYSPAEVLQCYGAWFKVAFASVFDPANAAQTRFQVMQQLPMYTDVLYTFLAVFKYVFCGILLALSGMLHQNTFRNPIAAPSMLGVSNGVNAAILILVLQYGYAARQMMGSYYLYSYIGGALILALAMAGGKYISGKGRFNVVNMLLVGTVVSQLLGVVLTYVQNMLMDETTWDAYYLLQTATGLDTVWTYVTLLVGGIIAIVPVVAFRFRLNLVSFDDAETRLLGVNADALRMLALACGSIMILTAQVNIGQVAMASLVIPFVVRAVFGAEFRKQLVGNILCGALIVLLAGDVTTFIGISQINLDIGSVVTICAMPLFVWMIAVQQRGWE